MKANQTNKPVKILPFYDEVMKLCGEEISLKERGKSSREARRLASVQ